tara:strand:- start:51 stop:431 length:381 start_codon:yes stop_codon:yes gene_type:complete
MPNLTSNSKERIIPVNEIATNARTTFNNNIKENKTVNMSEYVTKEEFMELKFINYFQNLFIVEILKHITNKIYPITHKKQKNAIDQAMKGVGVFVTLAMKKLKNKGKNYTGGSIKKAKTSTKSKKK